MPLSIGVIDNGLVLRDNFNRADGAPGTPWDDIGVSTAAIVSNELKVPTSAQADITGVIAGDVTGRTTLFSQVTTRWANSNRPALLAHLTDAGDGFAGLAGFLGNDAELDEWSGWTYNDTVADDTGAVAATSTYIQQLYTASNVQKYYAQRDSGAFSLAGTSTFNNSAKKLSIQRFDGGSSSANAAFFDNVISSKGFAVTVAGMQTGYTAQLLGTGDAVISEAVESGGSAVIPAGLHADWGCDEAVPYDGWTKIRILDDEAAEVDTVTLSEGIYPGASLAIGPTVTITNPADGSSILEGAEGNLEGEAVSPTDGDISADIVWESSIDGALGTGATDPLAGLTPGTHTITATAEDSEELSGSASITLTVLELPPDGPLVNCFNSEDELVYWNQGEVPPSEIPEPDPPVTPPYPEGVVTVEDGKLKVAVPLQPEEEGSIEQFYMVSRVGYDFRNGSLLVEVGEQPAVFAGAGFGVRIGYNGIDYQTSVTWARLIADPIENSSWRMEVDFGRGSNYAFDYPDVHWWEERFLYFKNLGPREWRVCTSPTGLPGSWRERGHGFSDRDTEESERVVMVFTSLEPGGDSEIALYEVNGINCGGTAPGGPGCADNPTSPCTLEWTLYHEDGVTIRAQSTTSPAWLGESGEAKPYLREPSGYGEQEVDFTQGTASLAQVNIRHVDVPTVQGDQDSGWFTDLLPHVAGNRNKLRRFTNEGWVTIADGPGSFPQLSETFAGFTHEIRDTREKERRLKAFTNAESSLLPYGSPEDFGGIISAVEPLTGTYVVPLDYPPPGSNANAGYIDVLSAPAAARKLGPGAYEKSLSNRIAKAGIGDYWFFGAAVAEEYTDNGEYGRLADRQLYSHAWDKVRIKWRKVGDTDYHTQRLEAIALSSAPVSAFGGLWTGSEGVTAPGDTYDEFQLVVVLAPWGAGTAYELADGDDVEFFYLLTDEASEQFPLRIDGLTAGEFLKNLYDGVYSPRDALTGDPIPTGIRYDEGALLAMTDPLRFRIPDVVKNVREWAEKNVYLPLGYAPALDNDGTISPRSDEIPSDPDVLNALTVINNAITQGVPGHAPGDNVINTLSFKYQRVYLDPDREETEDAPAYTGSQAVDGLSVQEVERIEYDPYSVERFGEQATEIETAALVAVGETEIDPETDRTIVTALEDPEQGFRQFFQRYQSLFLRRVIGTDLVVVPVMRAFTSTLRVGDWVRCKLSWIPNQDTGRRAVDHLSQILAIGETNCAWREMTMELVRDWDSAFGPYDSDYGFDEYGNFDPAFLQFAIAPQAPENGSEFVTVEAQANVAPEGWRWRLLWTRTTSLVGGGDEEPFPEQDITAALSPPAYYEDLPLAPGTTYQFPSGYQRNDATPTRHVTASFRFQVLDQNGVIQIDEANYPFDQEWDY